MTPKEKAFELKYKYSKLLDLKSTDELVIKCALMTVDEILSKSKKITVSHIVSAYKTIQDFNKNFTNVQNDLDSYVLRDYGYWQEVKHEIEKL
jgi:hypothetical protein